MLRSQAKFGGCANPNSARCWCWAMRCLLSILISLPPRPTAGVVCAHPKPLLLQDSNTWGALVWSMAPIKPNERKLAVYSKVFKKLDFLGQWDTLVKFVLSFWSNKSHILIRLPFNIVEAICLSKNFFYFIMYFSSHWSSSSNKCYYVLHMNWTRLLYMPICRVG